MPKFHHQPKPEIIPLPAWVLNDDELVDLAHRIRKTDAEVGSGPGDSRSTQALLAIEAELRYRGHPIELKTAPREMN